MSDLNKKEFDFYYQQGIAAFESGQYRISAEKLLQAISFVTNDSKSGGEANLWLVNVYQAQEKYEEAINLCQQLLTHPHRHIRQQSQDLLYIIQAPRLKRPQKWMSEIPDFNSSSDYKVSYPVLKDTPKIKPKPQIDIVDLSQVKTKDNYFIWLGLGFIFFTILGVVYFWQFSSI